MPRTVQGLALPIHSMELGRRLAKIMLLFFFGTSQADARA